MSDDMTGPQRQASTPPPIRGRFQTRAVSLGYTLGALAIIMVPLAVLLGVGIAAEPYVRPWAEDTYLNWIEGDPYLKVWVNPEARVYYGPGAEEYGNTVPGFYLSQAEARNVGYQSTSAWNDLPGPFATLNIGLGASARPLKTHWDLAPFDRSTLSWSGGDDLDTPVTIGPDGQSVASEPEDGLLTLILRNRSPWEIHEATVWIALPSSPRRTYRLRGLVRSNADGTFTSVVSELPPPVPTQLTRDADGAWVLPDTWTWGLERVRGLPP